VFALAISWIKDVNAHVEQSDGYKTDGVKVELDEVAFKVTAYPVDAYGVKVSGAANLVDKTLLDLTKATAYYEDIIHQLEQGDIIRNV
jgi:hypothetical protein